MSSKKPDLVYRNELLAEVEKVYKDHYEQAYSKTIHDLYNAVCKRIRRASTVEARKGKWRLHENSDRGTCDQCNFTQSGVWDYDSYQRYCGVCGAEMSL